MLRPEIERGRPGGAASSISTASHGAAASIRPPSDRLGDLDALAAHVAGAFVVVVEVTERKYRRRCYLTAKAAENAARRATERGENATVYLAELKPLWRVVA